MGYIKLSPYIFTPMVPQVELFSAFIFLEMPWDYGKYLVLWFLTLVSPLHKDMKFSVAPQEGVLTGACAVSVALFWSWVEVSLHFCARLECYCEHMPLVGQDYATHQLHHCLEHEFLASELHKISSVLLASLYHTTKTIDVCHLTEDWFRNVS